MMPTWLQVILGAAALVTALGVLWTKMVRPAFHLAKATDELVPLLRDFTEAFRSTPQVFQILNEVAAQFRTNAGSSLRDVVDRLEETTIQLQLQSEAARQLAGTDRVTLARLEVLLDALGVKVDASAAEAAAVASRLAEAQSAVDGVAVDLAASHARADAADAGEAGAAADAAACTDPEDRIP